MSVLEVVLLSVVVAAVGYFIVRWMFRVDEKMEDARRAAAELAVVFSNLGLKETPAFLLDFAVADVSAMAEKLVKLAALFLKGEGAVLVEFERVFDGLLAVKLTTDAGRAIVAAKLSEATEPSDPKVVKEAPKAGAV